MKNLSTREKILVSLACLLIIIFLYYNFVNNLGIRIFNNDISVFNNNKIQLSHLKDLQNSVDDKKRKISDLNIKADQLNRKIPSSDKMSEVIINLNDIIGLSGCILEKVTFNTSDNLDILDRDLEESQQSKGINNQENNLIVLSLECLLVGDYRSIISFIARVENNDRKMVIDKLSIIKNLDDNRVSSSIKINYFYIKSKKAMESIEYPLSTGY